MTRPQSRVLFGMFLACAFFSASSSARADGGIEPVGFVGGLGGANAVAVSPDGAHVYASLPNTSSLAVFTRDASTGLLTRVQTVNGVIGAPGVHDVKSIAISPDGKHLYLTYRIPVGQHPQGVSVYARDPGTGFVTFVEVQREGINGVTGLYDPDCAVVSADGLNVYVRSRYSLASFSRNATTGALTFMGADTGDDYLGVGGDRSIAITPDGTQVYMIGKPSTVVAYDRAPGTGALTFALSVENNVGGILGLNRPRNLAFSPDGAHLYVVATGTSGTGNNEVTVLARDTGTGALTYVERHGETRPFRGASTVAVNASGSRVYFTAFSSGDAAVGFYQRDPGTGSVTLAGSVANKDGVPAGTNLDAPLSIALSPDNAHVYVADGHTNGIVIFDVRCGDGVVAPGEDCDDGNNASGDGCWTGCIVEQCYVCAGSPSVCTPDDGTSCDDRNECTTGDTCAGGACGGTPDDGIACNDREVCTINDTCFGGTCIGSPEPEVGCRLPVVPEASRLKAAQSLTRFVDNSLDWKWRKGQQTLVSDFGDPVGGQTTYTACVYEPTATPGFIYRLKLEMHSGCSENGCWKATSTGYKYKVPGGGVRLSLKAGPDGKAAIDFGYERTPRVLPFAPGVTMQLKASHWSLGGDPVVDFCWGATFSTPTVSTDSKFKARSD
jgi:cysteine-rich repeat protein